MSNRIAIVVLACASPPYDELIEAIRRTWGSTTVPGLDIYYLYGNPGDPQAYDVLSRHIGGAVPVVADDGICEIDGVLIAGCADQLSRQVDCILRKRLIAFAHLAATDRYDLIYTVCAASYVDQHTLARYADSLSPQRVVAGAIGIDVSGTGPFVSGASMILSVDVARELGRHRNEIIEGNAFGFRDDVTMGHWIAAHMSRIRLASFLEDIAQQRPLTPDHIFFPCPQGTVDYVKAPPHEHRPVPNAFHYHFRSLSADHILEFHQRFFKARAPQPAARPRIFVSIASYRDQFLPFTIDSLLRQAQHPERLTFGICWQADEDEQLDDYGDDPRFRIRRYPYYASLGYGWARADIQKLYAGEEYHLLLDSHSYLAPGWDENLIDQLEGKPGRKPLLTTSSPPFTFDAQGRVVLPWAGTEYDGVPLLTCRRIEPDGWIDIQMSPQRKSDRHQSTGLICCNFVFTHGAWIREVPEDAAMIHAGHEAPLALRTFTHGYDMYLPDDIQVWHLDYANYPDGNRHKVWEAKSTRWQTERTQEMLRRLQALFYVGGDPSTLGRYGLGRLRTVAAWEAAVGLGAPA